MSWELFLGPVDALLVFQALVRILATLVLGAIIGYDREKAHRPAGLRSHMLLCLGAMLFIMGPALAGMQNEAVSRFGQGIGAMIGALALGTVLKQDDKAVIGLTTAMTAVPTAGIGIAIGLGYIWLAALATAAVWFILRVVKITEQSNRM